MESEKNGTTSFMVNHENECLEAAGDMRSKNCADEEENIASLWPVQSLRCPKFIFSQDIVIVIKEAAIVVAGNNNKVQDTRIKKTENCELEIKFNENIVCVIKNNPKMFPNALRRSGPCAGQAYGLIMVKTRNLTDAGLTQEFICFTDRLLVKTREKKHKDLFVSVLLQRVLFHIYAKETEVALKELEEAKQLSENCMNRSLLLGRCHTLEAYVKVYLSEFEDALDHLEQAKCYLFSLVSGEEKGMICYLIGYIYMKMAGMEKGPRDQLETKAIEYFQLHDRHVNEDSEREVAEKEMQYGILKQATVYLRT